MFTDVNEKHWIFNSLLRMVKLGRVSGFPDGTFQPEKAITRAEYVAGEDKEYRNRFNIIAKIKKAVCVISGPGGTGSGFLVDPETIITNVHVALVGYTGDKVDALTIDFLDGTRILPKNIKVPWGDGARDCAVLKIPPVKIEPLEMVTPAPGEDVYTIGCPVGLVSSVSKGIISHDARFTKVYDEMVQWLQVDAAVNPGNSGGALVNIFGQVVGMPTWKKFYTGETPPRPLEGLNFCLHYKEIMSVLQEAGKINLQEIDTRNVILNMRKHEEKFKVEGGLI